ncbi:hypothetical protein PGB90_009778 [Kerria lacca]
MIDACDLLKIPCGPHSIQLVVNTAILQTNLPVRDQFESTRWNSSYNMFDHVYKIINAINVVIMCTPRTVKNIPPLLTVVSKIPSFSQAFVHLNLYLEDSILPEETDIIKYWTEYSKCPELLPYVT